MTANLLWYAPLHGEYLYGEITSVTDPLNHQAVYTYDDDGNRATATDARNHETSYDYNADNELVTVHRPDTTTQTFTYDANGNRATQTD